MLARRIQNATQCDDSYLAEPDRVNGGVAGRNLDCDGRHRRLVGRHCRPDEAVPSAGEDQIEAVGSRMG